MEDLKNIIDLLRIGKTVLIPTDVDWAIACDATNDDALNSLLKICGTSPEHTVLLVDTVGRLQSYLDELPDIAWDLFEMTERPLTLRMLHPRNLAPTLQAPHAFCAFRVTKDSFSQQLCARFRRPIVCVSTGCKSLADIDDKIRNAVHFAASNIAKPHFGNESIIQLGDGNLFTIIKE